MVLNTLPEALAFIQVHGYFILFILMFMEGPIITAVAAFAASLGIFDVYIILILSILGNLVPDTLLYLIGRFSRKHIEKYVSYFGINKNHIKKLEKNYKNHASKTIIAVKLTPILPLPGLLLAGFTGVSFRQFFLTVGLVNLISAVVFVIIGFYGGMAISNILKYFNFGEYALLFMIPLAIFVYWLYSRLTKKIKEEIS